MGGMIWSRAEERVLWLELIPHSPKRLGAELQNEGKDWDWVAQQMTERMGDDARRKYTGLSVCKSLTALDRPPATTGHSRNCWLTAACS